MMSLACVTGNLVHFTCFISLSCLLDASAKRAVRLPSVVNIPVCLISTEVSSKPFYLAVWLVIVTFGNQLTTLPSN